MYATLRTNDQTDPRRIHIYHRRVGAHTRETSLSFLSTLETNISLQRTGDIQRQYTRICICGYLHHTSLRVHMRMSTNFCVSVNMNITYVTAFVYTCMYGQTGKWRDQRGLRIASNVHAFLLFVKLSNLHCSRSQCMRLLEYTKRKKEERQTLQPSQQPSQNWNYVTFTYLQLQTRLTKFPPSPNTNLRQQHFATVPTQFLYCTHGRYRILADY